MAWRHRLQNTGTSALSWGSSGAGIGSFFGPKGAAVGAGIGTILGALKGLLSDTEMQELAERWAAGEIDPQTQRQITRLVSDRFAQIRTQQGGRLARSGIADSTFAERVMADTDASERETLTSAMAQEVSARQQMGLNLLGQQRAETAQIVGGSIDNIMGVVSGLQADERYKNERADMEAFRDELLGLMDGSAPSKPNPHQMKAAATVGMMPKGKGRGSSGPGHNLTTRWGDLSSGRGRSVVNSRQGGGSYGARGANPWTTGSRQRKTGSTWFN